MNHPALCIIPPHILENISQRGTPAQRAVAAQTLIQSEAIRGARLSADVRALAAALAAPGKSRNVYDAKTGSSLPGTLVRSEGSAASADIAVNEAYDGAGVTYDLFFNVFGRNSIDGRGMRMDSTVHYGKGYDNAFWNGAQMVYGDGDEDLPPAERLFNRFTICLDVIGHELAHGVTQHEANLTYSGQPGALNESMSDVFGSLVKQYLRGQTADQADWIVGEGLFTANVNGVGIRSMKAPGTAYDDPVLGKDPQPAHINDYVNTTSDNGGVHINSGIPNHAFYTACTSLGGNAWEKMGRVWYKALTEKLTASSDFQTAANLTYQAAGELYGVGSTEQTAVMVGWKKVGIEADVTSNNGGGTGGTGEGCRTALMRLIGLR
ncbi:MAG: M4 family metallopeptidase [Chloroflexota bacterium]